MNFGDYFREEAARDKRLSEQVTEETAKVELLQFAIICEEVANDIEDRKSPG
jgi:hypothetical protein